MANIVRCPSCGGKNYDYEAVCSKCGTDLKTRPEEIQARNASFITVTTQAIEGRTVSEYLGVVAAMIVLGTGFMTEWNAAIADNLGGRATGLQTKLSKSCEVAISELKTQAMQRGADAVIGIDIDFMTFRENMLVVSANGTAVKLAAVSG